MKTMTKEAMETTMSEGRLFRYLPFEARAVDEGERTVELAFSSEYPVRRWGSVEILLHEKEAVSLERLMNAGSLLFAHGRDPNFGVVPVGTIKSVRMDDDRVIRATVQFDTDEKSELIRQKVSSGALRGVSFGYSVEKWRKLEPGEEWRGFKGPAYIGMKWEPYEISLEPIPADPTVGIGRSEPPLIEAENPEEEEAERMAKEEVVEMSISEEEVRKAVEAERTRVIEVMSICRDAGLDFEEYKDRPIEDVRKAAYDEMVKRSKAPATPPVEVKADESDKFRSAAIEALLARSGVDGVRVAPDNPFRYMKLLDMARAALEAKEGSRYFDLPPLEVAQRAMFGTSDFPYILANVAKKSLMRAYDLAPSTWQVWCNEVTTSDFKTMYVNSLSEAPDLVQKYPGGAYKMATFSEYQESYAVSTYGREFAMTREMIINDDLGAFNRISRSFGTAAKALVNSLPYAILSANGNMADGHPLFDATYHGNYAPSAGALSVTTLGTAMAAFRRQTDVSGNRVLNIQPRFLIVPPELEVAAYQLLNSVLDPTLTNASAVNPFTGRLQVVVDAELTDANDWYLAADPNQVDTIEVCFLEGFRGPVIESQQDFATDSIKIKVRQDVGAKAIDWRGLYLGKNS
jgi:phage head maturation protease